MSTCSGASTLAYSRGQRLGEVVVVVGQATVDAVLRGGRGGRADPVDQSLQRGDGVEAVGVRAPLARRLGHDLVDQRQQQLVLGGEVLVEGPQ